MAVEESGYLPVPSHSECANNLRDDGFHPEATCVERMAQALEWIAANACQVSRRECLDVASAALRGERLASERAFPNAPK